MPKQCCEYERNWQKRRSKIRETLAFFILKKGSIIRTKGKGNDRLKCHQLLKYRIVIINNMNFFGIFRYC
jgi:hypothetical protein